MMEDLFDLLSSFLPFIVLFLVLAAQIRSAIRRQRRNREDQARVSPETPAEENRPVPIAAAEEDEEAFSAWNLSVKEEEPPPEPKPIPKPVSLFKPLFPIAPVMAVPDAGAPPAAKRPPDQPPVRERRRKRAELFGSLPPLQQGILWAEILGPPKGL
jgi:cbb3-type cytochrome oxidase subunit 3